MLLVSKKITSIILSSLALIIIWANLLGSMSRAGYMGAFFGFIILIVLLRKLIIKDYKKIILIIIILISVFITINRTSSNSLEKEINRIDIGKETNIIEKILENL
jgi:multisubunit Na+/H+ antiporter MnhE subunit